MKATKKFKKGVIYSDLKSLKKDSVLFVFEKIDQDTGRVSFKKVFGPDQYFTHNGLVEFYEGLFFEIIRPQELKEYITGLSAEELYESFLKV